MPVLCRCCGSDTFEMMTIRPPGQDDVPALSRLFEHCFGAVLEPEVWRWKYRLLPGTARSLIAVDGGGEVVAHAGALRLAARSTAGRCGIWQLVDFMGTTRSRGLRSALVAVGQELLAEVPGAGDLPWVFGFPGRRHFKLGQRVFGYRPVGLINPLAGPLPAEGEADPSTVTIDDHCGEWAQAVWEKCAVSGIERSAAFLNWRYHARPDRYYRFYRLCSGVEDGLAVFAFHQDEALAAELWLPGLAEAESEDEAGVWRRPLLAVAADLRGMGMKRWRFWHPRSPRTPPQPDPGLPFLFPGLRQGEEGLFLGVRAQPGGVDPVAACHGFHHSMGDYDVV